MHKLIYYGDMKIEYKDRTGHSLLQDVCTTNIDCKAD